jgi:glycosyltransferase involved in cell wall biosynthesis
MNILFLSPLVPWPINTGGKQVLYNQIKGLSSSHDVNLICFKQPDYSGTDFLQNYCRSLTIFDNHGTGKVILNAIIGLAKYVPLKASHFTSRKNRMLIHEHLRKNSYDVIISRIEMAQFIPDSYTGPKILLMEDPETLKFTRQPMHDLNLLLRLFWRFENDRLARYEQHQARRFDRVTLLSEEDVREYQFFLPDARLVCIPYGTDPDRFSPSNDVNRTDGMIVFSGNMYHLPNVVAINHFCSNIFPLVKKEVSTASLWIVGANPVPEVKRWGKLQDITVTGAVPEILNYLRMARVSICPISLKIGVQTKVLEAMACGTPVVTTSAGNSGICATSGDGLYVADSPVDFALRIVSLLKGERWDEMSVRARRFVIDHFSWGRSVEKLEKLITDVINEHRKGSIA